MAQKIAGGKTRSLPGSEPRVTCHHELAEEVLVDEHDELITKPRKRRKMDSSTPDPLPEDLITLDDEPSEAQLMPVSKAVGGKWKAVLVHLEIKKNKIDSILQTEFGNVEDACFDGLVYWRNGNASKPVTWRTLFQSLREAGLEEETEGLKKMFNIPLDAAEDMEQEGLTEQGVTVPEKKVSSKCEEYLRYRYRNRTVVEDTCLDTGNPFHIPPTVIIDAKRNTRINKVCPNVSGFCKGPNKETYFPIKTTEILEFDAGREDRKVVLIEGAPGSGKSTTARYLCRLWAEGRIGQEYKHFIMIQLRALKNSDCSDISDLLRFAFKESLKEAAKIEILAHSGRNVLFLFDGWDECPQDCAIVHKIVDGEELPACSVIITSRYNSTGKLLQKKKIDRIIELAPFSPSDRVKYIEEYFDSEEKSDSLISLLANNPDLESLCSYPMMLSMICFMHHDDNCKALSTTTGVYDEFLCLVVKRYLREKQECSESGVEAALDIFKHTSLSGFNQYSRLALEGVKTHKFTFGNEDLNKWDIKFDPTRDCERTGIVLKSSMLGRKDTSYQFLHDSVQCFLAALEMSKYTEEEQLQILKNCIESLFTVYEHTSEGDEYFGQLADHRYQQQYSEELDSRRKYECKLSDPQPLLLQFFAGITFLNNPAIASTLIKESREGAHDQWCKSALPLILYESQNEELTKNVMREVLKPQIVVSCQDNFHLRCTAWCMAQAERKVEELTIILREHIHLRHFFGTCNDLSHLKTLKIRGSISTSDISPMIKVIQRSKEVLATLELPISITERKEDTESRGLMDSEIEEMSHLICSLPILHNLLIGSGSSQLTDALTEKVLQQAVSLTWKGKVLRVESSSPDILQFAFDELSELNSLYLIHYPSHSDGNNDVQELVRQIRALDVLRESKLKLLVISSFPSACFSHHLMQDVATAAVQRKYKEPMMIVYDTVTPGSEEAKNIIHVCVYDKETHTAFHVCAAQVNHLECVESFMEFSFIRLGKKWSADDTSRTCWISCHGSEVRGVVCSKEAKKHLPDLLKLLKRRGISNISLRADAKLMDDLRKCISESAFTDYLSEMNWDFDALEFLTFSGNKSLGDHARWDPHEGENVKCSLLKMLEQTLTPDPEIYWIPFGIHTLTVGEEGGLFPLQPQAKDGYGDNDVITLEVPEGAINTALCDKLCIRYGVIVYGPFDLPEGYQLGSMAVYIYFNRYHVVKPLILKLPHWAGEGGQSSLKCVVAAHRLEGKYKLKVSEEGGFQSREECGLIPINGHCNIFGLAFEESVDSHFYATSLTCVFEEELKATAKIAVTYSSSVWIEILKKYNKEVEVDMIQTFSFKNMDCGVKIKHNEAKGPGWKICVSGQNQVLPKDILYETHRIRSPKQLEEAVRSGAYPPCLTCVVTFSPEAKESGRRTQVKVYLEGTNHPTNLVFMCPAYEERSLECDSPSEPCTRPQQLPIAPMRHTTDPLSSSVDSDESFHTPPSHTPTEEQAVNGHFTGI